MSQQSSVNWLLGFPLDTATRGQLGAGQKRWSQLGEKLSGEGLLRRELGHPLTFVLLHR